MKYNMVHTDWFPHTTVYFLSELETLRAQTINTLHPFLHVQPFNINFTYLVTSVHVIPYSLSIGLPYGHNGDFSLAVKVQ